MQPRDRYRQTTPNPTPLKHRRKTGWIIKIIGLALVIGVVYATPRVFAKEHADHPDILTASKVKQPNMYVTDWQQLNQNVAGIINSRPDLEISVSVIDIKNNVAQNYGIQASYEAASTTKVLSAVAYLHQVEAGSESLNEPLGGNTAKYQLQQMINQSNNDSWTAINDELGHSELAAYAESIGLSSYAPDQNLITAADEASLLSQLYQGKLLNQADTKLLLSFMQNTDNELMIPAVAPSGAEVYHKFGLLDDRLHDAAIVIYDNRPIILTIYTKSSDGSDEDYTSRTTLIKQLAQMVFSAVYGTK